MPQIATAESVPLSLNSTTDYSHCLETDQYYKS